MELIDKFAIAALIAMGNEIPTTLRQPHRLNTPPRPPPSFDQIAAEKARLAYMQARAMLAARAEDEALYSEAYR